LDKAKESPNGQKGETLERETFELEKELGDHEGDYEWNRLLFDGSPKTKVSNERKHRPSSN
jgi:hypothetical protein